MENGNININGNGNGNGNGHYPVNGYWNGNNNNNNNGYYDGNGNNNITTIPLTTTFLEDQWEMSRLECNLAGMQVYLTRLTSISESWNMLPAEQYRLRRAEFLAELRNTEAQARLGVMDELEPLNVLISDLEYRINQLAFQLHMPMYDMLF
jgi:hypothetical protein